MERLPEIMEILNKMNFFQGQRAGRELWNDKPFEVQEEDLENFKRDINTIRSYIWEIVKKLKAYEDVEEQGLLLRLPCKVGEDVWCLEDDECYGYVFIAMSGEYYIVSSNYVHCDDIYEQLEEMEDDTENGFEPSVCVFHKDKVFLTKEEAEQALAKMKEV